MSFWIVGENEGPTGEPNRLAVCQSHRAAAQYLTTLDPAAVEAGEFYIDGPIHGIVELQP